MKKGLSLCSMFLVATFLIGAISWAAEPVPGSPKLISPTVTPKIGGYLPRDSPVTPTPPRPLFTSTLPSPIQLRPGAVGFTIKGTYLDSVTSFELVRIQLPVWRFPATILSKTSTAITARVILPKYLAGGTYQVWAQTPTLNTNTALIAQAIENKPSAVWTEFYPPLHGFIFPNGNWGDVCFTTVRGHLEYKADGPFCDSNWGLCGGMSLNAGERFRSGFPNIDTTHGLSKDAAKHAIVDAHFRTLDGPTVAKFFEWMASPDRGSRTNPLHSVGQRMMWDWNDHIKPLLDAHKPVVLGLIFDKNATVLDWVNPGSIWELCKQHQVLGIGYTRIGKETVRIVAYDPNIPDDILILTFTTPRTGVAQALDLGSPLPSSRRPVRGVMFVRGVP